MGLLPGLLETPPRWHATIYNAKLMEFSHLFFKVNEDLSNPYSKLSEHAKEGRTEQDSNKTDVTSTAEPQSDNGSENLTLRDIGGATGAEPHSENGGNLTTLREILCSLDFWLWTITVIAMFAMNLTVFSNIATYLRSLHIENKLSFVTGLSVGVSVLVISVACILSDMLIGRVERITWLLGFTVVVTSLLIWVINYITIFPLFVTLIVTTFTIQALVYSLAPVITLEYFGDTHFGKIWGSILFASGLVGLLVNYWFSYLYQMQIPPGDKSKTCYGAKCFDLSSKMLCIISTVSLITGGFLWYRRKGKRRRFYETIS